MASVIRNEPFTAGQCFSFADLERQGREVLAQARARAVKILQDARRQARQLAEQERQAGHDAGLAAGREAGVQQIRDETHAAAADAAREQVARLTGALAALLDELEQNKRRLIAAAESGLIELALAVARRVCKLAVGASTAVATANVRALLERVQHAGDVEVHLHPAECEWLREMEPEFLRRIEPLAYVRLVPDEGVPRGGCRLCTRDGEIDAAVETQLERIAAALLADHGAAGSATETELPEPRAAAQAG